MKPKQLLFLSAIFALLVLAVVLRQLQRPPELTTEEYAPLDFSFDESRIGKIEIYKPKGADEETQVSLVKEETGWKISTLWNARADVDKVEQFLTQIKHAKGEIRAKDQSLFEDFGIRDDEALHVKLSDLSENELLHLLIGTKKADDRSLFIRKNDSEVVYVTNANLYGQMGVYGNPDTEPPKSDYWVSTQLAHYDTDSVKRIEKVRFEKGVEIVTARVALTIDPYDSTKREWKFERSGLPFAIDPEKIKQFLESAKTWVAKDVVDSKAKDYGFSSPLWRLSIVQDGREPIILTAAPYDSEADAYPIQVSTEPVVFQLSKYYFENLDIDDSKFFRDNPLQVEPDQVEKLVIHTPKQEMSFEPKQKTWEGLTNYLNDLKTFRVDRMLFDAREKKKVGPEGENWIKIQLVGKAAQFLDVGELITKDTKTYAASIRGTDHPFAIDDSMFQKLFGNLDRLATPEDKG
ncbi:MAG: hypothetical protein A3G87_08945 [Omnitrophica bacterium RIFCSPLOWO2_12_FULL_50_11]|nr:MAG: hypothetical protein A3G87_08945 [Omnitrophica bacterium RIFCSPLOWO2_12_FULL_50_11]